MSQYLGAAWLRLSVRSGWKPTLAVEKDTILDWVHGALKNKQITTVQALAFLSANVLLHPNSLGDEDYYIHRTIMLYNANSIEQVCKSDSIKAGSPTHYELMRIFFSQNKSQNERMQAIKSNRYTADIVEGSSASWLGLSLGSQYAISKGELRRLPQLTSRHLKSQRPEVLADGTVKETYALLDIEKFYPILLKQRKNGHMTESQCALFLCFILHGLEGRANGESYIDHPMAVAQMVRKFGPQVLKDRKDLIWRATLAALLHDVGEQTNFKVDKHLKGLLSADTVKDVNALHLKTWEEDGIQKKEPYFDYIQRIATSPVTAFVKLCDITHNTDGHSKTILKQDYVYRLAAAYLRASIERPEEVRGVSVKDWAVQQGICETAKDFERIENIAKKDVTEDGVGIRFKLERPVDEKYLAEIRLPQYANPRGKEGVHFQFRADV
ncbi:MAG: HD domain-containing protein [Pseudomonadota bacterium]